MSEKLNDIKKLIDKIDGGMIADDEIGMISNISYILEQIVEYLEDMEKRQQCERRSGMIDVATAKIEEAK